MKEICDTISKAVRVIYDDNNNGTCCILKMWPQLIFLPGPSLFQQYGFSCYCPYKMFFSLFLVFFFLLNVPGREYEGPGISIKVEEINSIFSAVSSNVSPPVKVDFRHSFHVLILRVYPPNLARESECVNFAVSSLKPHIWIVLFFFLHHSVSFQE